MSEKPYKVESATRAVIENKLLTALEDANTVAALLSRQDLEDMIMALDGYEDKGYSDLRMKRLRDLSIGMKLLLSKAFPANKKGQQAAGDIGTATPEQWLDAEGGTR